MSRKIGVEAEAGLIAGALFGMLMEFLPAPAPTGGRISAVCRSCRAFRALNASLESAAILIPRAYHIGIAVATAAGLIVPMIRHADRLSVRELARTVHRVAEAARARKLQAEELTGATFTITNPRAFGGILSTPIIHRPQAAILGVQQSARSPWGETTVSPLVP